MSFFFSSSLAVELSTQAHTAKRASGIPPNFYPPLPPKSPFLFAETIQRGGKVTLLREAWAGACLIWRCRLTNRDRKGADALPLADARGSYMNTIIPIPRTPVAVRMATAADLSFIDRLQKLHSRQVGWMPTKQLESKIAAGDVVVAEERHEGTEARRHEGEEGEERHVGTMARRHEGEEEESLPSLASVVHVVIAYQY